MAKNKKNSFDDAGSEFKSFADKLNEQIKETKDALVDMRNSLGTDIFKDMTDDISEINDAINDGLEQYGQTFGKVATGYKQMLSVMKESNRQLSVGNEIALNAKRRFEDLFDTAIGFLQKIPGGGILQEALGLDTIKSNLSKQLTGIFSKFNKDGQISLAQIHAAFKTTFSTIISTIGNALKLALTNPIFIAIAAVAILTKLFFNLQDAVSNFRKETGLGASQLTKIEPIVEDIAFRTKQFGANLDDAFNAATALYKQYRNINGISPTLVSTIVKLSKNFAISEDSAAGVLFQLQAMSGASNKTVSNMAGLVIQAARIAKVSPQDIFNDIAENSEFIYTYFKGTSDELVKTAIDARRLGLSLGDIEKITENLLDFNTSIENTMMASLLTGKQLNFMNARRLVFEGKISDATQEVYKQIKSIGDFDKLNVFQKRAIASAIGLSVGELSKSLAVQRKIGKLSSSEQARYKAAIKALNNQNNLTGQQILLQKEQQVATENIKNAFMGIVTTVGRLFLPILNVITPILNGIANIIDSITSPINETTSSTQKWIKALTSVAAILGIIVGSMLIFKGIAFAIGKIPMFGGGGGGILSSIGKGFTSFAESLQTLINPTIIGGLLVFVATMIGLGYALSLASDGIKALGTAFGIIIEAGGKAISQIIDHVASALEQLSTIGSGLFITAEAIFAVSAALLSFTGVGVTSGIASFLGLGNSNVINQLQELGGLGPQLNETAKAINNVSTALQNYSDTLEALDDIKVPGNIDLNNQISTINKINNNQEDKVSSKLDEMINLLKSLTFEVDLDGKKVGMGIAKVSYPNRLG